MSNTTNVLTEIALGSMTGVVAGYTFKKLSQMISLGLITGYAGLQLAKMKGWVNDNQVTDITNRAVEFGRQQVSEENLSTMSQYTKGAVNVGVPSALSFGGGFYLGFFYG